METPPIHTHLPQDGMRPRQSPPPLQQLEGRLSRLVRGWLGYKIPDYPIRWLVYLHDKERVGLVDFNNKARPPPASYTSDYADL